ncbi:MAG: hypothetical protein U0169_24015 [Polyangiaceae bacterium]
MGSDVRQTSGFETTRRRSSSVAIAFACGLSAWATACADGDSTGITYTPRSNLEVGRSTFVIRVHGSEGRLDMCGIYPVDEGAPPGDSASLVRYASSIVLVPKSASSGARVRVVAELHAGTSVDSSVCAASGERPKPLVRKVFIAGFSEGHVLPVGTTFDVACLGVVDCDETRETCRGGRCESATVLEATGDVGAGSGSCLDLASSTVARDVGPLDASCRVRLPGAPGEGTLLATFRFAGATAEEDSTAAAVLDPSEYTSAGGADVELVGRTCDLLREGYLRSIAFVTPCVSSAPRTTVCANADGPATITSVATSAKAATDGGPDATIPKDGSSPDVSAGDGGRDGAADATLPGDGGDSGAPLDSGRDASEASTDAAGGDGGTDSGDGGMIADDSGTDGESDSGVDEDSGSGSDSGSGGVSSGPGLVVCEPSTVNCSLVDDRVCCRDGQNPSVCTTSSQCVLGAQDRFECDDRSDCQANQECCFVRDTTTSRSVCMAEGTCESSSNAFVLCSAFDPTCPFNEACYRVRPGEGVAEWQCNLTTGTRHVDCRVGGVQSTYCVPLTGSSEVCCEDPIAPANNHCSASGFCGGMERRWTCDDASDCPDGYFCCVNAGDTTSSCLPPAMCSTAGGSVACSRDDTRCPPGESCTVPTLPTSSVILRKCAH